VLPRTRFAIPPFPPARMPKKSTRHRPFRSLAKLEAPRKVEPRTFSDRMVREGTARLEKRVRRVPPPPARRAVSLPTDAPTFRVEREEDFVAGYRSDLSASTRSRLRGTPMATLDLHHHDTEAARKHITRFLSEARALRRELVLVIVGRGRHSPGGHAVLRHEVDGWLTTPPAATHVLAFRTAPRDLGGSGGIVVLLAPARERRTRA
jgi:DNA-nicking Smr family endonuclease